MAHGPLVSVFLFIVNSLRHIEISLNFLCKEQYSYRSSLAWQMKILISSERNLAVPFITHKKLKSFGITREFVFRRNCPTALYDIHWEKIIIVYPTFGRLVQKIKFSHQNYLVLFIGEPFAQTIRVISFQMHRRSPNKGTLVSKSHILLQYKRFKTNVRPKKINVCFRFPDPTYVFCPDP